MKEIDNFSTIFGYNLVRNLLFITVLLFNLTIADSFSEISSKAMEGDIESEKLLAEMYRNGDAGIIDEMTAFSLYQSAAQKNDPEALYLLGELLVLNQDYNMAIKNFILSAEQGYAPAMHMMGIAYEDGLFGVEQNYKKSFEWYKKLSEIDDNKGLFLLGFMYENGFGIEKNIKVANQLYKKACENGYKAKCH